MTSTNRLVVLEAALACATLLGCDTVESSDVATSELRLYVDADVFADGSARIVAQLATYHPALLQDSWVRLAPGDDLRASLDDEAHPMGEEYVIPIGLYQYALELPRVTGGELLALTLNRAVEVDASNSSVVVPAEFSIAPPGASFTRAAGLELSWSADVAADSTHVNAHGVCITSITRDFDGNPGQVTLPARDWSVAEGVEADESCPITVTVSLINQGVTDSAFHTGGSIRAEQIRRLELLALP